MAGIAELSYTKTGPKMGTIELVVPQGTKVREIAKLREPCSTI